MKSVRHKNIHGGQEEISGGGGKEKGEELYRRERVKEGMKDKTCRKGT
jgi:hypothetical protein